APHAGFGQRLARGDHQKAALRAQDRTAAQIRGNGSPGAARGVAAVHGAEEVRVSRNRLENHRALVLLRVREDYVDSVDAEGIALGALRPLAAPAFRGRLLLFALALLERIQIVQDVVPHFLEVFRHLRARVFLLQFLDYAVYQDGSGLLLEIAGDR